MNRVFPLVLLLCAAACASSRNTNTFDVRASSSGRGRAFEFDRKQGELIAWSANGKLLQLWVHPGELDVGTSSRRTVEEGCRGGFLTRSDPEGSVVVEIHLCPLAVTRAHQHHSLAVLSDRQRRELVEQRAFHLEFFLSAAIGILPAHVLFEHVAAFKDVTALAFVRFFTYASIVKRSNSTPPRRSTIA